jgi:hypothetical protein
MQMSDETKVEATTETITEQPKEQPAELEKALARIAELERERDADKTAHESALAEQRLKTATAQSRQRTDRVGTGQQDVALQKAIQACGGPAFWGRLSPQQKAAALGVADDNTPDKIVKQFFGPTSCSADAQRLHDQNPAEYARLRALAKARGIL